MLSRKAKEAFDAGRLDDAVRTYQSAFEIDADPALLFNIAYIYELKGDAIRAEGTYREVTRSARSTPDLKVRAYERIEVVAGQQAGVELLEAPPVRALGRPRPRPGRRPRCGRPSRRLRPGRSPRLAPSPRGAGVGRRPGDGGGRGGGRGPPRRGSPPVAGAAPTAEAAERSAGQADAP
ncbi:MAG: hypothetical protein R3F60_29665 [bacterium]